MKNLKLQEFREKQKDEKRKKNDTRKNGNDARHHCRTL
jgi:hypothetical protein